MHVLPVLVILVGTYGHRSTYTSAPPPHKLHVQRKQVEPTIQPKILDQKYFVDLEFLQLVG